jgi:hypothetical protein
MGQKISEKQMKEEIRSVVRQNIKEVTTNDWHYKAIMSIWDKGGSFTRKKIAAVLCGDPKADRRDVEDALRNSGYDEVTDVTDRLRIESIITEKQLKGLDGISSNTPLDKISKDQKLKIIKAPGNIIDFIVPKGVSRNFWQVIGTGKVKKNAAGEHYLEGRVIDSPMFKSIDDLIDGVQWDSMEERRRFNEGIIKEGEDQIPGGLAKGMTLNDIAEKHGMSVDMLVAEFKKGIQTEMEHTTDREMAKEITMDHLFEDPQYYTKLATVEEYVDDKGVEHVAAALPQTEEEPIKEGEDYTETPEETLEGLKEMAMGNLERIEDYAEMISDRMKEGQELDSWMYSQLTIALENLNSVHDAMDGIDGVKESVNESLIKEDMDTIYLSLILIAQAAALGGNLAMLRSAAKGYYNLGPIDSIKKWWKDRKDDKSVKSIIAKIKSDPEMIAFFKLSQNQQKGKFRKLIATKLSSDEIQYLNRINKSDLQQNESVNEATESDIIAQIKDIAKKHQNNIVIDPKSGKKMRVDAFSASAIATVYDALSDSSKEKFLASGLLGMQQMAMKLLKK